MDKRIVSLDPASYRNLGWSIVQISTKDKQISNFDFSAGTIVIENSGEPWKSLYPLYVSTRAFLTQAQPDLIIIEKTSSFSGGFITGQVSNCIGVILAVCGEIGVEVVFVFPTHAKKMVTGKGRATKAEMKKHVLLKLKNLGHEIKKLDSEHSYDAMANVFTYLLDQGYEV